MAFKALFLAHAPANRISQAALRRENYL